MQEVHQQHQLHQHKKQQQLYQCAKCPQNFTSPYTLKNHSHVAHDENLDISTAMSYAVPVVVSTKGKLDKIERILIQLVKTFFLVSVVEKKKIQKKMKKKEISPFICLVCAKSFSRLYNLGKHQTSFGHQKYDHSSGIE